MSRTLAAGLQIPAARKSVVSLERVAYLRAVGSRVAQAGVGVGEDLRNRSAERIDGRRRNENDEHDQQRVLKQVLAFLIPPQPH